MPCARRAQWSLRTTRRAQEDWAREVSVGLRLVSLELSLPFGVSTGAKGGSKWQWLKIKELGLHRFWSMFPLTRATHFGTGFLSHTQMAISYSILRLRRSGRFSDLLKAKELAIKL